jgi:hypothetical protein
MKQIWQAHYKFESHQQDRIPSGAYPAGIANGTATLIDNAGFQGRVRGCKGMWHVDSRLKGLKLRYRPSQQKIQIATPTDEQLCVEVYQTI